MTMIHPGSEPIHELKGLGSASTHGLARVLRSFSLFTMFMTIPQVLAVWSGSKVSGVSVVSWLAYLLSAGLWLVYGLRKHDKTIYLACIGWILLDLAVVIGVLVHH